MVKFLKKYYFVFLPLVVTAVMLLLHMVRYIINDDIGMLKIAESFTTNSHSEHLVFISVILGYAIKFLYHIIPNFNWFITLYLVALNFAFIALYGIIKKLGSKVIGIAVIVCAQIYFLSNLTFTSISFICSITGMLWLFIFVPKIEKKNIKYIIIGAALILLGFMMRRGDTFYFTILLFVPLYIFSFVKKRNSLAVLAMIILICTCSNYFVIGVQNVYNKTIPAEVYFSEFRKYRAAANDGGEFNYERHTTELQEAGITENDYDLLKRWVFGDKKVYSSETMKAIAESRDFDEKYNTNIKDIVKQILGQDTVLVLIAVLLLLTIITFIFDNESRLETLFVFAFTMAAFGFLYFRRRGIQRVSAPVLFCGIIISLSIFLRNYDYIVKDKLGKIFNKKTVNAIVGIICVIGIIGTYGYCLRDAKAFDRKAEKLNEVVEYTKENSNNFYVCDTSVTAEYLVKFNNDNILKPFANNKLHLHSFLGTWTMYTYYYYDNLKNLGLEEYADRLNFVLLKENTLFITKKMSTKKVEKFFKENYNIDVKYKKVKTFPKGKYIIYDFSEKTE